MKKIIAAAAALICILSLTCFAGDGFSLFPKSRNDIVVNDPEEEIIFEVYCPNATPDYPMDVYYDWYRCNENFEPEDDPIGSGTTLNVGVINAGDCGKKFCYKCVCHNTIGESAEQRFTCMLELTDSDKVVSIEVTKIPDNTVYNVGDEISIEGLKIRVYTENGFFDVSGTDGISYSPFKAKEPGKHTVTITYEGVSATVNITVNGEVKTEDTEDTAPSDTKPGETSSGGTEDTSAGTAAGTVTSGKGKTETEEEHSVISGMSDALKYFIVIASAFAAFAIVILIAILSSGKNRRKKKRKK